MPGRSAGRTLKQRKGYALSAGFAAACLAIVLVGHAEAEPKEQPRIDLHGDPLPDGALARLGTQRWRHGDTVSFVAFLPDGKAVVTASQDNTIRLWDRATGKELRRFGKQANDPNAAIQPNPAANVIVMRMGYGRGTASVVLSPDGKALAATMGIAVQVWDTATGKELCQIKGPQTGAAVLAFSPDSKLLAGRGFDQTIYLWDAATGKETQQIKDKAQNNRIAFVGVAGGGAPCLTFSADGKTLISGEAEVEQQQVSAFLKVSDVATGNEVRRTKVEQTGVSALACSPDGKTLAWASNTVIRLDEAASGKEIRQLKGPGAFASLVFAPDGKTLASRDAGAGQIRLWETETGKEIHLLGEAPPAPANNRVFVGRFGAAAGQDVAFSPDGKTLAAGGNNTVRFFDAGTGKEVAHSDGHRGPLHSVHYCADGKTVASTGADSTVRRWEAATGKELSHFQAPTGATCVGFTPDGATVALGNRDNTIRLYDTVTGKELHKLTGHPNGALSLAFTADGKTLASRGADNAIRLYDTASGKDIKQISMPAVNDPAGRPVAVAFASRYGGSGFGLTFSPDGKLLATPSPMNPYANVRGANGPVGNSINLYDTTTGKEVRKINLPPQRSVSSFAFSPDGRMLAVENFDQTITVYEVASGKERVQLGAPVANQPAGATAGFVIAGGGVFQGAAAPAPTVAFASDGRKLASKSGSSVRVWDVIAGKELKQFQGHQGEVVTLAFAPDGKTLASGSNDTTILLWNAGSLRMEPRPAADLTATEVESLWADLVGDDGVKAFRGILTLAAAPKQAAPFLKGNLKPAAPVDQKVIDQWIADLESEKFSVRQKAAEELEKLGEMAVPVLNKVLASQPPLETRKRVEELLERVTGAVLTGEQLRLVRAVEVLERMGTPEARGVLETLSRGAAGALPTREAQNALGHLNTIRP